MNYELNAGISSSGIMLITLCLIFCCTNEKLMKE